MNSVCYMNLPNGIPFVTKKNVVSGFILVNSVFMVL